MLAKKKKNWVKINRVERRGRRKSKREKGIKGKEFRKQEVGTLKLGENKKMKQ